MDKKTTGIIAYLTIVGWLIAYLTGDKEGAKFHLNQSLVLAIAEIVLSILTRVLTHLPLGGIVSAICSIALFVFWIMGFVSACKDEEKPVPVIGTIQILK